MPPDLLYEALDKISRDRHDRTADDDAVISLRGEQLVGTFEQPNDRLLPQLHYLALIGFGEAACSTLHFPSRVRCHEFELRARHSGVPIIVQAHGMAAKLLEEAGVCRVIDVEPAAFLLHPLTAHLRQQLSERGLQVRFGHDGP